MSTRTQPATTLQTFCEFMLFSKYFQKQQKSRGHFGSARHECINEDEGVHESSEVFKA